MEDAGLGPHKEQTINANGSRCRVMPLTFCLLLSKIPSFYSDGKKVSCPVEGLHHIQERILESKSFDEEEEQIRALLEAKKYHKLKPMPMPTV